MKETLKGLVLSLATICVLLIMAVPAFADAGDGYYVIEDRTIPSYSSTQTIHVKLVIQSREYSNADSSVIDAVFDSSTDEIDLTGKTEYTVRDVLLRLNEKNLSVRACDSAGNDISATADYVYQFMSGSKGYGPLFYADHGDGRVPCDGWVFRVNGQYPLLSEDGENNGPEGGAIDEVPIADGDVVYFYFNHPWKESNTDWSTKFVAANAQYSNGSLSVQLQYSNDYHTNKPYVWNIGSYNNHNYAIFTDSPVTGTLYDSNHNIVTTIPINYLNGSGSVNYSLDPGIYYLRVDLSKTWISRTGYIWFTGYSYTTCNYLKSTMVYDRIVIS